MRKMFTSILSVFIFIFLIISSTGCYENTQYTPLSPHKEIRAKQALIKQDLLKTNQLLKIHNAAVLQNFVHQNSQSTPQQIKKNFIQLKKQNANFQQLIWYAPKQGKSIIVMNTASFKGTKLHKYLEQAKTITTSGKTYESKSFNIGKKIYYVLSIPSTNHSAVISIIHQQILDNVYKRQRKDLRTVPYPSDKRWKLESVDTNSMQPVKVNHPEDNEGTSHYHVYQIVVKFKKLPNPKQMQQIRSDIYAVKVKKLDHTYVFESKKMDAKKLKQYFKQWDIEYAEPHYLYMTNSIHTANKASTDFIPNDALYARYQWDLPMLDTELGWKISKGNKNIIVAVVDTGADLSHPDLKNQLVQGYNFIKNNNKPNDDVGHGTHVSGVIAAIVNNKEGVAGMTWYNKVMPLKVLDHTGAGSTYSVSEGIIWAADHGAKIINLSLGNYADSQFLHDAIKYAFNKDVVIIAASGNDNTEHPGYPAAYPEVFAVGATNANRRLASFSNFGDYIDVVAPGVSIASTYMNHQYAALSGTSMASPHVTALAALIRSTNPLLTNIEVMNIMRQTAQDLGATGKDKYYGYGQIDVVKALQAAEQSKYSLSQWSHFLQRKLQLIEKKYK